jgi:hypothetical protein
VTSPPPPLNISFRTVSQVIIKATHVKMSRLVINEDDLQIENSSISVSGNIVTLMLLGPETVQDGDHASTSVSVQTGYQTV